jgi:hypothetical protein
MTARASAQFSSRSSLPFHPPLILRGIADRRHALAMGPLAEALGYDSVCVMDYLLSSGYIRERLDDKPYYHPLARA